MKLLVGSLLAAALIAAPACAQTVMLNFSWPEMRSELTTAGVEVTSEGGSGKSRYLAGKDDTGLMFGVYGFECDTEEQTQRCRGADFIASFTLKDASKADSVLDMLDYAAVSYYRDDEGRVKISRYMIFDGGVTRENLQTNISVFLSLSNQTWDKLDDEELLK